MSWPLMTYTYIINPVWFVFIRSTKFSYSLIISTQLIQYFSIDCPAGTRRPAKILGGALTPKQTADQVGSTSMLKLSSWALLSSHWALEQAKKQEVYTGTFKWINNYVYKCKYKYIDSTRPGRLPARPPPPAGSWEVWCPSRNCFLVHVCLLRGSLW